MGRVFSFCCPACGYEESFALGVGYLYPLRQEQLRMEIRDGKWGEELQAFVSEQENAVVDGEQALFRCPTCGNLSAEPRLDRYLLREGADPGHHLFPYDDDACLFAGATVHHCSVCGAETEEVRGGDRESGSFYGGISEATAVPCPNCGEKLRPVSDILWD